MKQIINSAYKELFTTDKRYVFLLGGRGAGRSTVASQYALANLIGDKYSRTAIMRYILGDIRNSIYREIKDRASESEILDNIQVNDSLMSLSYGANTINAVGFKKSSGDQKAKLKSLANYNCIIIEEADEISEEDFIQLDDSIRTVKGDIKIIFLLNPPSKSHWIIKRFFNLLPSEAKDFYIPELKPNMNATFIRTSYKDNIKNIDEETVLRYEGYKTNKPDHYYNMIAGLIPEVVRGKIFSGWNMIDDVPFNAELIGYGLDFGFTNDPASIIAVYRYDGGYIADEVCYQTGLSNKKLADLLSNLPKAVVVADSAEPKSIEEIKTYGITIIPCEKGADSIRNGIQLMQGVKISVTKRSQNLIREYENYKWWTDKNGETLNEADPRCENHAIDALRYRLVASLKTANYKPQQLQAELHQGRWR